CSRDTGLPAAARHGRRAGPGARASILDRWSSVRSLGHRTAFVRRIVTIVRGLPGHTAARGFRGVTAWGGGGSGGERGRLSRGARGRIVSPAVREVAPCLVG